MTDQGKTILLTGVTGFAGKYVARYFLERGFNVIGAARRQPDNSGVEFYQISNLDSYTYWKPALEKTDFVVHLAGRAHQMKEKPGNEHLYFETNVDATINLALQAAEIGVKKFIFISTVKAMGEGGTGICFNESTVCEPMDAYGRSKLKAEIELQKISHRSGMPVVTLRPPLMYGPDVKGNMASLIKLVRKLPAVPFGGIDNRRSLLGVRNLASAIEAVINSDQVFSGEYVISDGESISTSELVDRIIRVFQPNCKNLVLPATFWKVFGKLPVFAKRIERLSGSLEVDSSAFCRELNWKPVFSMVDQFKEML